MKMEIQSEEKEGKKEKEGLSLSEIIRLKIREKGIDTKRLSLQTGIEEKYCEALRDGDFEKLPADIYVRGYLFKIAEVFGLDADNLWSQYKKEKQSFSLTPYLSKNKLKKTNYFQFGFLVSVFLISLVFIIYQISSLFLPPKIELSYPSFDLIVSSPSINIKGVTNAPLVEINNKKVYPLSDGSFDFNLSLLPGLNIIKVEAKNQLGKKAVLERKIFYQEKKNEK